MACFFTTGLLQLNKYYRAFVKLRATLIYINSFSIKLVVQINNISIPKHKV